MTPENGKWALLALAGCILWTGCGPRRPRTAPVRGTVTFAGQPVPEGRIVFHPERLTVDPDRRALADEAAAREFSEQGSCFPRRPPADTLSLCRKSW